LKAHSAVLDIIIHLGLVDFTVSKLDNQNDFFLVVWHLIAYLPKPSDIKFNNHPLDALFQL
jgi:hypothetical protein